MQFITLIDTSLPRNSGDLGARRLNAAIRGALVEERVADPHSTMTTFAAGSRELVDELLWVKSGRASLSRALMEVLQL